MTYRLLWYRIRDSFYRITFRNGRKIQNNPPKRHFPRMRSILNRRNNPRVFYPQKNLFFSNDLSSLTCFPYSPRTTLSSRTDSQEYRISSRIIPKWVTLHKRWVYLVSEAYEVVSKSQTHWKCGGWVPRVKRKKQIYSSM